MTLKSDAKFEEKLICGLQNDMRNNLGLWWDSLIQSGKSMSLKFTEELCVTRMKNYAKFKEELTCCFKVDIGNLINFDPSTWKSQKDSL